MMIMKRAILILLLTFSLVNVVNAEGIDQDRIKGVQSTLNYWGYDCGTPDGVAGAQTAAAVRQFQRDQGIEATGEITATLINRMIAGIPWNVFEKRYNEAVDYWNLHTDMTSAPIVGYLHYDVDTEDFSPNSNLTLSVNPNYKDKKMVGLINLGKSDGFDSSTAMVEGFCTFYAFDQWMETPLDATDTFDGLFKDGGGRLTIDGIEYTNFSTTGIMLIKGMYENFEGSPVASSTPEETVTEENSEGTRHITDFNTFYEQCVEDNKLAGSSFKVHELTKTSEGKNCFQVDTQKGQYLVIDFTIDTLFTVGVYSHNLVHDEDDKVGLMFVASVCLSSLDGTSTSVAAESIKQLLTTDAFRTDSGYGILYGTNNSGAPFISMISKTGE